MKNYSVNILLILLLLPIVGIVGDLGNAKAMPALSTPEAAVERALAYTGFAKTQELSLSKGNVEAVMTTPDEAGINLMREKTAGDNLWNDNKAGNPYLLFNPELNLRLAARIHRSNFAEHWNYSYGTYFSASDSTLCDYNRGETYLNDVKQWISDYNPVGE